MDGDSDFAEEIPSIQYTGKCPKLFPQRVDFDEVWNRLKEVIETILAGRKLARDRWNAAFTDVFSLCGALPRSLAIELYDKVDDCVTNYVIESFEGTRYKKDAELLEYFITINKKIINICECLNNMFRHLNAYISHQSRELQIEEILSEVSLKNDNIRYHVGRLVLIRWKQYVLVPVGPNISKMVLEQFDNSRNGKPIEMAELLKQSVNAFIQAEGCDILPADAFFANEKPDELKLYKEVFETPLQASCQKYYHQKSVEWSQLSDSVFFIESVANLMENEKTLARTLMNNATTFVVERWAAQTLVAEKMNTLKLSFKPHMTLEVFNAAEIRKCFNVLKLIENGLADLIRDYENYILLYTKNALGTDSNDPKVFVNAIAATSRKMQGITEKTFDNHPEFCQIMDRALRSVVNGDKNSKPGDKLARYADAMLRKSAAPDEEKTSANLGTTLKYLNEKEHFERPYQMLLAKRLLERISAGHILEESMIEVMRDMCGTDFVQKFVRMLQDITKSGEESIKFKQVNKTPSSFPIDFTILQTGAWPLQIGKEVQGPFCPEEVAVTTLSFTSFYTGAHTGRQLTWAPSLSTVDVKLTYLDKPYTVTMTAIHYDIICCFERHDSLTLEQVCELSRLTVDGAKRYLRPMFDNQLLICDAKDDLQPESILKLNMDLTRRSNRFRLGIPMTNKVVKTEIRPENAGGQNSQRFATECAIVRIMKAKKKLKHQLLVAELIDILKDRFSPSTIVIKQCVESLIERAYMKRTEDMDEYEYIA